MPQPFKFRFVHEIVGLFVVVLLGLLVAGVFYSARIQGWFEEQRVFQLRLPGDAYTGVRKGTQVYVADQRAGDVTSIRVDQAGGVIGELQVRGSFLRLIREGSKAVVRKRWGVAGDTYLEISRGTGEPLDDLAFLPIVVDEDLTTLLLARLQEVGDSITFTMFRVNELLAEYTELARSLQSPALEMQLLLEEATGLVKDLRQGQGALGRLLTDDTLIDEAEVVTKELQAVAERLQRVMADVQRTSSELPAMAAAVPDVLDQAEQTLHAVETLVEGLQRHWLVRKYVEPGAAPDALRLGPGEIHLEGGP